MRYSIPGFRKFLITTILFCLSLQATDSKMLNRLPLLKAKLERGKQITILGLGDSITTHFGNYCRNRRYYKVPLELSYYGVFSSYLKMHYPASSFKLINKGVGGETANRGLERVERDVLQHKPDLVFVMYGANDGRGGRDIKSYTQNLHKIVTMIKHSGAEVILVAPTMSLADIFQLLPYRQAVLKLAHKLDTPVLDGTLALWPVDENVSSLKDVLRYLSLHFPHYGDNIHPWFPGHAQMGRRLSEQLLESQKMRPLKFSISAPGDIKFNSKQPCVITVTNTSNKKINAGIELFFTPELPVTDAKLNEIKLPNGATAKLLALPFKKISLQPGASTSVTCSMKLPPLEDLGNKPTLNRLLNGQGVIAAALFTRDLNYVELLEGGLLKTSIKFSTPTFTRNEKQIPLRVAIQNTSENALVGKLALTEQTSTEVSLAARKHATRDYTITLPEDKQSLRRTMRAVLTSNTNQILGIQNIKLQALKCIPVNPAKITIDGKLDDWKNKQWHTIPTPQGKFTFAIARESNSLLLALKALDPVLEFDKRSVWAGDGFELYLDPNLKNNTQPSTSNFQVGFFPSNKNGAKLIVVRGVGTQAKKVKLITANWQKLADGYTIEARIPTSAFTDQPLSNGQIIGLSVACNDVIIKGEKRKQYHWAGGNYNFCDPISYGFMSWGAAPNLWRINLIH